MQNMLIACKILILRKLEQVKTMTKTFIQDDEGFRVTNPEGFVAVDKLKSNQYVNNEELLIQTLYRRGYNTPHHCAICDSKAFWLKFFFC
mgnify:CR=1 FL=1